MDQISDKILKEIKEQGIKPTPHWFFMARDMAFWFLFGLFILIGALAIALDSFLLYEAEHGFILKQSGPFWNYLLVSIPYLWIFLTVLFLAFAYMIFRKTRKGYGFEFGMLVFVCLISSVIIGALLHYFGVAERVHMMALDVPYYENLVVHDRDIWFDPAQGYLVGTVTVVEPGRILLTDYEHRVWTVEVSPQLEEQAEEMCCSEYIKLTGRQIGEFLFAADAIK